MKGNPEVRALPELLSPVGGRAQLEAAVNNGADAVYMGGSLFNARINAENFTEASLVEAIDFAHERGVKVYITFNTLIRDSELERAFRYACRLYEMGADALILQDMGLARLVHKYLPDFPMHLSTQGTVYNVHALDLVRQLGFRRVVPARELSLEEIGRLCAAAHGGADEAAGSGAALETEVFVHGALCMCYSGQCQMSRAFGGGGRSGNRGLCAQPCRLLYTDDKGRTGYFLSPKDLCALELIPQLITAGVDSFKIEGRLKSAEYVAVTTSVYRKYLDLYGEQTELWGTAAANRISAEEWKAMIDPADMQRLKRIFNRGGFTTGYLGGNPGEAILSGESPKNQGIYIGKVISTTEVRGKGNKATGREKVLVDIRGEVSPGDGIEIRRPIETGGITEAADVTGSSIVTFLQERKGGVLRIGDFDRSVRAGDRVYKVTDRALREEVLAGPEKTLPVSMRFEARVGQAPELEVNLQGPVSGVDPIKVFGDFAVEKAVNRPLTEDKITGQLMKLGGTSLCACEADIDVAIDPDIMVPVSVINSMRRSASEELAEALRGQSRAGRTPLTEDAIDEIIQTEKLGSDAEIRRVEAKSAEAADSEQRVPFFLNVTKGAADRYIEENFEKIAEGARGSGILLGNLGWVKQFLDAGVTVYGDYGLNAFNGQAVRAYEELGIRMVRLSHEMCADGNTGDERFGGRIPLMITEHPFSTGYLVDRKGVKHEILRWDAGDKYLIF